MFLLEFYNTISYVLNTYNDIISKLNNTMSDEQYYNYHNYFKNKMFDPKLYYYLWYYVEYFNLFPEHKRNIRTFIKKKIIEYEL